MYNDVLLLGLGLSLLSLGSSFYLYGEVSRLHLTAGGLSAAALGLPALTLAWLYGTDFGYVVEATGLALSVNTAAASLGSGWLRGLLFMCIAPTVTFLALLLTRPGGVALSGLLALTLLLTAGLTFTLTNSLLTVLVGFELLLLSSLYLLRLTSKSERILEAAAEMFFWTLLGSVCLLIGLSLLASQGILEVSQLHEAATPSPLLCFLFILGFGVKVPIWPCFSWLLKAHVEASVEFSILLSGVIVKFGALGLYRFLEALGQGEGSTLLLALALISMFEASFYLLGQRDLKRVVALTTVIEMNWASFALALGGLTCEQVAIFILIAHSFTTTAEFFMVECLNKRYGSRDILTLSGLHAAAPALWACSLATTLTTIGFPGTSLFTGKVLFLTSLLSSSILLFTVVGLLFLLILPLMFMKVWVPVWFGASPEGRGGLGSMFPDVSLKELVLLSLANLASPILGLWPALCIEGV